MDTNVSDKVRVLPEPWWLVLLQGIAAIVLGILLLVAPTVTTIAIVQVVGIYWLVTGILGIVHIFIDSRHWGWKLLSGILGIIAGVLVIQNPLWSSILLPATLVILFGIQGVIMGVIFLIRAFGGAGLGAGILGVIDIIFGAILLSSPLMAVAVFPLVFGSLLLVGGLINAITAISLRGRTKRVSFMMENLDPQGLPSTGDKKE
jgi:uncharacterized membrane protein HdeD (DUF308 family)